LPFTWRRFDNKEKNSLNRIDKISVIIPSLNPSDTLVHVVDGLIEAGFGDIIVVNDGSDEAHAEPFDIIGKKSGCTVLTHPQNIGKGAALKTAFSYFVQNRPEKEGLVTMDGDGQHLCADVVKCAHEVMQSVTSVIIGTRDFRHADVPRRNSLGNRLTAFSFRILFGIKLTDTQTGLRGIPVEYVPMMTEIPGNRFEYETNMLIEIERQGLKFLEVDIETVYEEGSNSRSHYRPLLDSIIIFSRILKYSVSSLLSFFVDIGLFWLAIHFLRDTLDPWSIPAATAIARVFSSFFNFNIYKLIVFRQKKSYSSHLWRYYTLAAVQMLTSAGVLWVLDSLLAGTRTAGLLSFLKMLVDTALFFMSYYVQRRWVFKKL